MEIVYYQDIYCYYVRKPAGIPSTFGKEKCFLEFLWEKREKYPFIQSLEGFFGKEKEFGLLNRLDNDTSGLLYFAKNPRVRQWFKGAQSHFLVHKYYLAEVYGDPSEWIEKNGKVISYPIMHHKYSSDRMVVIKDVSDEEKGKGRLHCLATKIIEREFFAHKKTAVLLVEIQKGIRHQIRAHLAAIGHPICGDSLYVKSCQPGYPKLQLFSVGLFVKGEKRICDEEGEE